MANLFYGVSTTGADTAEKEVTIYNPLHDEIVFGDLLAVYFSDGNTVESPTLVVGGTSLSTGEDEQEALAEDAGIFIKTRNVEAEVDYMWQAGEVCIFVLVSQQDNTDVTQDYNSPSQTADSANDTLYYMLVRGSRANSEYYGLTKLFTDSFEQGETYASFQDWLAAEDVPEDKTTAATPYLIKQLSEYLIGKVESTPEPEPEPEPSPEPEPEPTPVTPALYYNSEVDEGILIGTLYISGNEYQIQIPNTELTLDRTSQLHNDADIVSVGAGIYEHDREQGAGSYFITNVIDSDLYLYKPSSPTGIYIADNTPSGDSPDIVSPVEGGLTIKPLLIKDPTSPFNTNLNGGFADNPLNIYGNPIKFFNNEANPLMTIGGNGGIENASSLPVTAPEFIEGGVSLTNKYSRKLVVKTVRLGYGITEYTSDSNAHYQYGKGGAYSIQKKGSNTWTHYGNSAHIQKGLQANAKSVSGHMYTYVNFDNFEDGHLRPLGIVGYDFSDVTSGTDYSPLGANAGSSYSMVWELFLKRTAASNNEYAATIQYDIRNLHDQKISVILDVKILCERV